MRKYWYTPQLMVPSTIEMETGNIILGTWTRYFLSITMLPDQIKVNWRVRPIASKYPESILTKWRLPNPLYSIPTGLYISNR